ncbi:hypothetical protein TNCV_4684311 [Trichonephila clavipes]|nr:hypothetical protein TNCV_4684311 [Trichonephila clavipes]
MATQIVRDLAAESGRRISWTEYYGSENINRGHHKNGGVLLVIGRYVADKVILVECSPREIWSSLSSFLRNKN